MLTIHQSNHVENLFEGLGAILAQPLVNPLTSEIVVVQHQGMARWLSLQLAARFRICANVQFPFPAAVIWRLFAALGRPEREMSAYGPESMTWMVLAELDSLLDDPVGRAFNENLTGIGLSVKRYQMARRVATCFDKYMAFRPDWIRRWEAGAEEHWQARLWRRLRSLHGGAHRVAQLYDLFENLDEQLISRAGLPERLSLFGIPSLSVAQLEVFSRLAEWLDVHLFLLNPCRSFWDDILSDSELAKKRRADGSTSDAPEDYYCEGGNALLASLGKQGREFQRLLHGREYHEIDDFREPVDTSLLTAIQADILNGRDRQGPDEKIELDGDDRSIQIHIAHSPMREVEILYDQLLAMFAAEEDGLAPSLTPGDILVMTPDIALYAPFVEAVFANPEREEERVPFSVADRGLDVGSPVIRTFFSLLRIGEGRLPASQVLALLEVAPLRQRFGIRLDELEKIRRWVNETGIHWGIDGGDRQAMGLPATRQGSWKSGLDRLLLGYAMGGQERLFSGILPYDAIDESGAELLGRFASFLEQLSVCRTEVGRARTWPEWHHFMSGMIDRFLDVAASDAVDLQVIRNGVAEAVQAAEIAGFTGAVEVEVVAAHLESSLAGQRRGGDFLAGRVTFCQMVPMRSIPFKVVCLLGMEDGAFPRVERWSSFDLMAGDYRLGDRLQRDDDRYLFLETLLAARQVFYVSYVGRSIQDNQPMPPSTVVDELLEYVRRSCQMTLTEAAGRLVTIHPLQPFSQRYFGKDGDLFTFSESAQQVAVALGNRKSYGGLFTDSKLASSEEDLALDLHDFVSFFSNPTRFLLKQRFGLLLDEYGEEVEDRELFSLDHLQRYKLTEQLVETGLAGEDSGSLYALLEARGAVPEGVYGSVEFRDRAAVASEFVAQLLQLRAGNEEGQSGLAVDLTFGNVRLTGRLDNVWGGTQCLFRPTKVKDSGLAMRDTVELWLFHLVLNAITEKSPPTTVFVGLDGKISCGPVAEARQQLGSMIAWYRRGMTESLPLFPKTSMVYANSLWRSKRGGKQFSPAQALERARRTWQQGDFQLGASGGGERFNPYFLTAFGDSDPLAAPLFHEVADAVLGEALRHQER